MLRRCLVPLLLWLTPAAAQPPANPTVHFTASRDYLARLSKQKSIQTTLELTPKARTKRVHRLSADCEIHLVATSKDKLGKPNAVVVEPPNLCKFDAPEGTWPATLDRVLQKKCTITGFPRFFTEHAKGAGDPANPNHFLELHPASEIACGATQFSFSDQLEYFKGMSHIQPATAANCLAKRKLWMRRQGDLAEFHQEPNGGCGNFAIVEVRSIDRKTVEKASDGFAATAAVSADGQGTSTLRLYGLENSKGAEWLEFVRQNGLNRNRVFVHGMLTYDSLSIARQFMKTGRNREEEWQSVEVPLALVIFGFPKRSP